MFQVFKNVLDYQTIEKVLSSFIEYENSPYEWMADNRQDFRIMVNSKTLQEMANASDLVLTSHKYEAVPTIFGVRICIDNNLDFGDAYLTKVV